MAVHICQCLCPHRHAIMGFAYDTTNMHPAEALQGLEELIELAISQRLIRRRCEVCGADSTFHYEDANTIYRTIEEARVGLAKIEAAQLLTQLLTKAERN